MRGGEARGRWPRLLGVVAVGTLLGCSDSSGRDARVPVDVPGYAALRRAAVEGASAEGIAEALVELEAWHRARATEIAGRLAAGRTEADIARLADASGVSLPDEVVALYRWHDGVVGGCDDFAGPALLGYHCFLSLEEALRRRRRPPRGAPRGWLPLFYFQDEYFYVAPKEVPERALPILYHFPEDEERVAFLNLRAMVETFIEAGSEGIWHPEETDGWDSDAFEAIRSRSNPGTGRLWR